MNSAKPTNAKPEVKNGFQIPKWAGKPPSGLHLDVMKESKMIQKLMIDEKNCYFFGRNKDTVDFVTDHASCSRVHAALVWHKHLNRSFIIDLGSAHGTFIGSIKLDPNKPQQVFIDSELKFGASTRTYIIRERPQANKHFPSMLVNSNNNNLNDSMSKEETEDYHNSSLNLSALPETEAELDNLTEFNTAHNKRISQLVDNNANIPSINPIKKKKKSVSICEEEDIINPEDIDPSVGRFRNMVQTTFFIPNKKKRPNQVQISQQTEIINKRAKEDQEIHLQEVEDRESKELYTDSDDEVDKEEPYSISTSLGINLAPDVDEKQIIQNESEIIIKKQQLLHQQAQQMINRQHQQSIQMQRDQQIQEQEREELLKKKKYAKESWPGRKPANPQDSLSISISNVSPGLANKLSPGLSTGLKLAPVSPKKNKSPSQPAPKRLLI